jgi:hypothetical protein
VFGGWSVVGEKEGLVRIGSRGEGGDVTWGCGLESGTGIGLWQQWWQQWC